MGITVIDNTGKDGIHFRDLVIGDGFKMPDGNICMKIGTNKGFSLTHTQSMNLGFNPLVTEVDLHVKVFDNTGGVDDDDNF